MEYSGLKDRANEITGGNETWSAATDKNESLQYRRVTTETGVIAGVRHEYPDAEQRLWRTEIVYRSTGAVAAVGVRVHCLATEFSTRIRSPKRPYFLKLVLRDSWPAQNSEFPVADTPYYAKEDDDELVAKALLGNANSPLPVVYLSRDDNNRLGIDAERLAYDLGGLAHVAVEPSRATSFRLMDLTSARNPYGGTIGIAVAGSGLLRKFYLGAETPDERTLSRAITLFASEIVSAQAFSFGCDWQNLQEAQTEFVRNRLDRKSSQQLIEYMSAFDLENAELKAEVSRLAGEISTLKSSATTGGTIFLLQEPRSFAVTEIYSGEVRDRLKQGIDALLHGRELLDGRAKFVLTRLLDTEPFSGGARSLSEQIKAAGRDSSEMAQRLGQILTSLGFTKRSDGKHYVYIPPGNLGGVTQVTLPKTPSDHRAGRNQAAELIRNLGLNEVID